MEQVIETFIIPKNKKIAKKAKKATFIISFLIYPLVLFALFYIYVNINSILLAFRSINLKDEITWVGFKNFKTFIDGMVQNGELIKTCFVNSIKMYFINLIICIPLYILFSYLLFKQCFAHKAIRAMVMIPQIISGFIIAMLFQNFISGQDAPIVPIFEKLKIFVDQDGYAVDLLYTEKYAFGTTIFYAIWLSFGTNLIVYPNAMKEINPEVIESSRLDGVSSTWQDLWHIVLPLIFPTFSTFLITGLAGIFSNDGGLMTFYYVSAPHYVQNMGYYYSNQIVQGNTMRYPQLAAGGLILTAIVAPLTLLLRYLLERFGPSAEA